jgi:hypothetical protein
MDASRDVLTSFTSLSRDHTVKTLKEFLSDRAEIERGRADAKKALQTEWIWSVRRLVQQVRDWLSDADQEGLLTIKEDYQEIRESELGVYTVPRLLIQLQAQEVSFVPISRMVVGPNLSNGMVHIARAYGRVDLKSGDRKYLLFRSQKEPTDSWVIVEDEGFTVKRFDRDSFEEAMQSLLQ